MFGKNSTGSVDKNKYNKKRQTFANLQSQKKNI